MATAVRNCPKCGGALTPAAGDAARRTCADCGASFSVRTKSAAVATTAARPARGDAFADRDSEPEPAAKTAPAAGPDSRLVLALVAGGVLAFLFLGLAGAVVLTVVLWPRGGKPAAVAVVPVDAPAPAATPVPPADPAPKAAPKPAPPGDNPDPPKKVAPPKDAPPPPPQPQPQPQPAAPVSAPPDVKPAPNPIPPPAPPASPQPQPQPQPAAVNPIDQAIDKGVAYLKKRALGYAPPAPAAFPAGFNFGRETGEMGLIGLALLESGVPSDDPAVKACTDEVRAAEPTCGNTYEMAISIWFLDRLNDPKDEDLIHDLGARLVAGQLDGGLWTYNCPLGNGPGANPPGNPFGPANPINGFGLMGADLTQDQLKELMETLEKYDPSKEIPAKKQLAPVCHFVRGKKFDKTQPGLGQPGGIMFGMGDLSLTQFATLGLWVARKHHVPVDRSVLMTEARVRAMQAADGGWSYNGMVFGGGLGMGTTDSMTCSGMMEIAVARGVGQPPGGKTEAADPQFEKGLEYLEDLFDRGAPPGNKQPPANAAQAGNLAAAVGRLMALQAQVTNPFLENQPAQWKKSLKAFQDELERDLALDLPADAKKDLQDVDDQLKKYDAAPSAKEKKALVELIQKTNVLQGNGLAVFGLSNLPGRFLKPGKSNRNNADDIYCLWSLERLCMVCDLKTVAGRDWYAWGANLLVADQNDDGSWPDAGICGPEVDTCMAVLFLKRVNVARDLTAQLQMIAPIKDLPKDKIKYVSPGGPTSPAETPSPGLIQPPPADALKPKEAPKP